MDVDALALRELFSVTTGIWTIAAVLMLGVWRMWNGLPAVMAQWIAWRKSRLEERETRAVRMQAAKDADWDRLRAEVGRLGQRIETLEAKVEECERDRHVWMARAIRAEAILGGQGDLRSAAAGAIAEYRVDEDKKRKETGK